MMCAENEHVSCKFESMMSSSCIFTMKSLYERTHDKTFCSCMTVKQRFFVGWDYAYMIICAIMT